MLGSMEVPLNTLIILPLLGVTLKKVVRVVNVTYINLKTTMVWPVLVVPIGKGVL